MLQRTPETNNALEPDMVPMKATVGFNLYGVSAAANGSFNAPNADVADKLETARVAEREKADKPTKAKSASAQ